MADEKACMAETRGFLGTIKETFGQLDEIALAYHALQPLREEVVQKYNAFIPKYADVLQKYNTTVHMSQEVSEDRGVVEDAKAYILAMQSISSIATHITDDGELILTYADSSNISEIRIENGDLIIAYN